MTERFKDIEVSADLGLVLLYTTDTDYKEYDPYELLELLNKLNELNDENEHLIRKRGELETKNIILEGENKELKTKVNFYKYFQKEARKLEKENEQLKAQLYCDDEEGVCSICKYHYLVIDDEAELEWYNSRCTKGHYECGKVCLKKCEDFEKRRKKP